MNIGWNIETFLIISSSTFSVILSFMIIKIDWKKYGLLFLLSAIAGTALCYIFLYLDFYSFPYRLFPQITKMPITLILTVFPFYVLLGVRYSPKLWPYKIPFYWSIVHFGVFLEALVKERTRLIKYNFSWNLWDSYTWWWIFLLLFELVGGIIISPELRKPLDHEVLRYGKLGWFILHFILISTIFLAGVYSSKTLSKQEIFDSPVQVRIYTLFRGEFIKRRVAMKFIDMKHVVCDYTCMWNGLEDIYRNRTGFEIPPYFFFGLSGFCTPAYLKISKGDVPRSVYFNSGLPKKMYTFMENKIGFKYSAIENRSFQYSLKKAKEQIDNGSPVVIGATDMYHLEYSEKFYHKLHIPIHYFLMIGYDDEKEQIYLYDCSKPEMQALSYTNLEKAWNVNVAGLSKKNTLFIFEFMEPMKDVKTIFYESLKEKAEINLNSRVNFIGCKAFNKLAKEIGDWKKQLTGEQYKKSLLHLVEYAGLPPTIPDKYDEPDNNHAGARFEFAQLLRWDGNFQLELAAKEFIKSGKLISNLSCEIMKCALLDNPINTDIINLINYIGYHEESAYRYIQSAF